MRCARASSGPWLGLRMPSGQALRSVNSSFSYSPVHDTAGPCCVMAKVASSCRSSFLHAAGSPGIVSHSAVLQSSCPGTDESQTSLCASAKNPLASGILEGDKGEGALELSVRIPTIGNA